MNSFKKNNHAIPNKYNGPAKNSLHSSLIIMVAAIALASMSLTGCSDTTPIMGEEGSTDETPPTVESSTPADNSYEVAVNTEVTVTFSEEIDGETLNMSFYNPSTNASVRGTTEISGSTLTFTPDEPLRNGGSYELLILEVDDMEGNTLEEVFSLVFHTERP